MIRDNREIVTLDKILLYKGLSKVTSKCVSIFIFLPFPFLLPPLVVVIKNYFPSVSNVLNNLLNSLYTDGCSTLKGFRAV